MIKSKLIILLFLNLKTGQSSVHGSTKDGFTPEYMNEAHKRRLENERLEKENPNYKEEENKKQTMESWEKEEKTRNPWYDTKAPLENNVFTDMITSIKNLRDYK